MQPKTSKNEARQPKCAAPRLGYEHQKATYYCFYLGHQNEVTFVGEISEHRPRSDHFVFIRLFRIHGRISTLEEGRESKGGTKRGGASCRELPEDQVISCGVTYKVPGGGRKMERGGSVGKAGWWKVCWVS